MSEQGCPHGPASEFPDGCPKCAELDPIRGWIEEKVRTLVEKHADECGRAAVLAERKAIRDALLGEEDKREGEESAQGDTSFLNGWNLHAHRVRGLFAPGGRFEIPEED